MMGEKQTEGKSAGRKPAERGRAEEKRGEKTLVNRSEASALLICLDAVAFCDWNGRLYVRGRTEPEPFRGVLVLLEKMEAFYDWLDFPQVSTLSRSFQTVARQAQAGPEERTAAKGYGGMERAGTAKGRSLVGREKRQAVVWSEQEMRRERGALATFLIRMQYRQSSTWQGKAIWMEKDRTLPFCSTLEMLKWIERVLGSVREAGVG